MISLIYTSFSIGVLALGFLATSAGNSLALLAGLIFLFILNLLLVCDLEAIHSLLRQKKKFSKKIFLTSFGREILAKLNLFNLDKFSEANCISETNLENSQKLYNFVKAEAERTSGGINFYRAILKFCCAEQRLAAAAVYNSESKEFESFLSEGFEFQAELQNLVTRRAEEFLEQENITDLAQDSYFEKVAARYNIRYAQVLYFGNEAKKLLFFIYQGETFPDSSKLKNLSILSKLISSELCKLELFYKNTRELSELKSKVANQQRFIAHFAHDLRTPLQNLKLNLADANHEQILGNFALIDQEILNLLDCANPDKSCEQRRQEVIDVCGLVSDLVSDFRKLAESKSLRLSFKVSENLFIYADKSQIRRIFANLISNSIKYSNKGGIEITGHREAQEVFIYVLDEGIGIKGSDLQRIFFDYEQLENVNTTGFGLGLASAKRLAEINQGKITAQSRPGEGSKFSCVFPLYVKHADNSTKEKTFLVVDDDAELAMLLARGLEREGFLSFSASSFQQAKEIINFAKPNYFLLDANMPDGGAERMLKEFKLPLAKYLVMTGSSLKDQQNIFHALGASAVYEKPVTASYIANKIAIQ